MRDLGRKQAERGEAFAATQAFLDGEDLGVEPGVLERGSAERRERRDEVLVIVGETIGPHGHAKQHAEGVVFVAHRDGEQRRRGHRFGEAGEEMLLGLTGERHHDRASAGDHRTEGGPVERDARGEGRGAEVAVEATQVQHVVDEVVVGACAGSQEGARMPGQIQRDTGLVAFPGEPLGGAHERFQLRGLGAELPEQPDAADGLRGFVGEQREERDVLLREGIEPVGIAVHDADHVPHELHRDGQLGTDALPDLDVTRILRDVGDPLRLGVEGDPPGDALPLLDDLPGGISV